MPLIDGRYEVLTEQQLPDGLTRFGATAPDGTLLRIDWFELKPEREPEFERYRRLLKRLTRTGQAAIHDVVSRPGARYVAWVSPPPGAQRAAAPEISAVLGQEGYPDGAAELLRVPGNGPVLLYGLGFGGAVPPPVVVDDMSARAVKPLRRADEPKLQKLKELSPRALSWGGAGVLLLVALLVFGVGLGRRTVDRLVRIPDVMGAPADQAAASLRSLGLSVVPVALASEAERGTVIGLEPRTGSELRPGRSVRLSYALPPGELAPVDIPDLVGLTYPGSATEALEEAGLTVAAVSRVHSPSPAGTVLGQSADPGRSSAATDGLAILVSAGPQEEQTFVPDLVGLDLADARAIAELAGIDAPRVQVDEIVSGSGARGQVLSQSLAPYVPVPQESSVLRLVVQAGDVSGDAGPGAPDLVGLDLNGAEAVAPLLSLEVETMANPGLPVGIVAQSPEPGTALTDGRLTVVVNSHPRTVPAPEPVAIVRRPQLRYVSYAWTIQPGINEINARVMATTDAESEPVLVESTTVRGGDTLRGSWLTTYPGIVKFELFLGGVPYGQPLLVP